MDRFLTCITVSLLCFSALPPALGRPQIYDLDYMLDSRNSTAEATPLSDFRLFRHLLEAGHGDITKAISKLSKARARVKKAAAARGKPQKGKSASEEKNALLSSSTPSSVSVQDSSAELPELADPLSQGVTVYGSCATKSDCSSARMFCVEGQCRCPVLFTGENCDEPVVPFEPWCLTPLKSWPKKGPIYKDLKKQNIDFTSCAVVGSSSAMKKSKFGPQIDKHTAIFRFNEAPAARPYRADVGSSTTLRFQNRDRSGFAEVKGEICVVRSGKWQSGQDSGGKCRFMQMPTEVEHYMDGHWKIHKQGETMPRREPGRPWFSNGFTGVAFAMHMCGRVTVYGYTFGTGYYFTKYKGIAKGWGRRGGTLRPPSKRLEMRHSWNKERECLKFLGQKYPASVVVQASKLEAPGAGR